MSKMDCFVASLLAMAALSFLRKQEPITTGVRDFERYLSFLLQRGAAEYGSRIALRLSGTTAGWLHPFRRHCERKRSNPWLGIARSKMDCFVASLLAMTLVIIAHTPPRSRR